MSVNRSASLEDATNEFNKLHDRIRDLFYKLGDECQKVEVDHENLDEVFMKEQYSAIAYKLDEIRRDITYLSGEIVGQGFIKHNSDGRYELPNGQYLTSGSPCEILVNDDIDNSQYWVRTRIEHNGEDYYAVALGREQNINGMMVRVREFKW